MRVASCLGFTSDLSPTLQAIEQKWDSWSQREPALVDQRIGSIKARITAAGYGDPVVEEVIRALIRLGAVEGGDDPLAATAVAWLYATSAERIAYKQSQRVGRPVGDHVATALWMTVRELDPERCPPALSASILWKVRHRVAIDLDVASTKICRDRAWQNADLGREDSFAGVAGCTEEPTATSELLELLEDAEAAGAISDLDRRLILDLVVASIDCEVDKGKLPPLGSAAGLTSGAWAPEVAARWGFSERTLRRRTCDSIDRLRAFATGSRLSDFHVAAESQRPRLQSLR